MSADPSLVELVNSAEAGKRVPRVQLVTGSTLVAGLPIPHAEYVGLQEHSIGAALWNERKPKKSEEDDVRKEIDALAAEAIGTFRKSEPKGAAIALKEAVLILLTTGEAIETETARVPIHQVTTWWAGAFKVGKPPRGWGFFVGGFVPVGE